MARGRFINTSIATDTKLNSLSIEAHWLYMMTIPHLDRDGLIIADTYVLFGKVCPRRPEVINRIDELIAEWVAAGLVTVYSTEDGSVAYFHGFAKNQQGMTYSREGASTLSPPPGYTRTNTGLTQDELTTNSCNGRAEVKYKSQYKSQVEVQVEVEAASATAAANPDIVRIWKVWDANMPGTKTPVIVDGVNGLLDDYSAAEIEEAIRIACSRNKRNLSYVQGILAKGAFTEQPKPSGGDYRPSSNGRMSPVDKSMAAADELRALLISQGKEHILHG